MAKEYRKAVLMLIKNEEKFLLAIPSGAKDYHIPGGGVENKETYLDAFYREAYEELGLKKQDFIEVKLTNYSNKYDWPKHLVTKDLKGQNKRIVVAKTNKKTMDLSITKELEKTKWVSYDKMIKTILFDNLVEILKDMRKNKII